MTIDIRELPARLDEALASAAAGNEVVLLDGTTPRARLVPYAKTGERIPGLHPGAIEMADDFDAPCPTTSGRDSHEIAAGHARAHLVGQRSLRVRRVRFSGRICHWLQREDVR